jgi:hypothetical protein
MNERSGNVHENKGPMQEERMVSRRSLFKGAAAGLIAAGMGARNLLAQLIAHRTTVG